MFSDGEIGVMLDGVADAIKASRDVFVMPYDKMLPLLEGKKLSRTGICPDRQCFSEAGTLLAVDYILAMDITQVETGFKAVLAIYDVAATKNIAETSGEFAGTKNQMTLKFLPQLAKELIRTAQPYITEKNKIASARVTVKPADEKTPANTSGISDKPVISVSASSSGEKPETKNRVLKSPALWVPVGLAIMGASAAMVYYFSKDSEEESGKMAFPEAPEHPQQSLATEHSGAGGF
jgi:hypothetical protein